MESGRAIQLISVDPDTGKFNIEEEAISILSRGFNQNMSMNNSKDGAIPAYDENLEENENKIAVIGIAGKYRTGKSLIMNLLSGNTENNFEVSASVNACTRGLWIYSEPITIKKEDEEIIDVYLMDSEGLGGVDKNQNYDVQIFTLAMLLSSFFIFNSYGVIDENSLNSLSLVTNLANKIQNSEDEEDAVHLINHFPTFLWVLRDFVLDLQDDEGNEINPDQYLEYVLEETEEDNEYAETHNAIRATLKRFFPERYCATLVRPSDDERDLQSLKSDPDLLKPAFVNQINDLRNFILNQIQIKSVGDIGLTGSDYIRVVERFVTAVNEGAIPRIEDSWVAVVENQLENGYSKGFKSYQEGIRKFEAEYIPCNDEDLFQAHKGIMQAAIETFLEITKDFDNQEKQDKYEKLQADIEALFEEYHNGKLNDLLILYSQ